MSVLCVLIVLIIALLALMMMVLLREIKINNVLVKMGTMRADKMPVLTVKK